MEADVLPVDAHAHVFAPTIVAWLKAADIPLSLKLPDGFMLRGRVHDDVAPPVGEPRTEITAKARVRRNRAERHGGAVEPHADPAPEGVETFIHDERGARKVGMEVGRKAPVRRPRALRIPLIYENFSTRYNALAAGRPSRSLDQVYTCSTARRENRPAAPPASLRC